MVIGLAVLAVFIVASRFVSTFAGEQLRKRQVRGDVVVLGRRIATAAVILVGILAALGFAVENANVPLFGLLLATVVAALGVQDVLKDYVSGYYMLLERHIRVGDYITFDSQSGTVSEVRLRVTILKADDGDVIVVPNSELFTKPVTIRTSPPPDEPTSATPA